MSTNLRQIKLFFVSIAIISIIFLLYTINWNVNIYKFSSEISQVNYRSISLSDNAASQRYSEIAKQYIADAKNITIRYDITNNIVAKETENSDKVSRNKTELIYQNNGNTSNSNIKLFGDDRDKSKTDGVIDTIDYYDGNWEANNTANDKVHDTVNKEVVSDTIKQDIITDTDIEQSNDKTDEIKDKVKDHDNDKNATAIGNTKTSDVDKYIDVQHVLRVYNVLNQTDIEHTNGTTKQKDANSKVSNDIGNISTQQNYDSVKHTHFSAMQIASANKEIDKIKSRWVKKVKKKNETLSLRKDIERFRRVKNQLKQLGQLGNRLKPLASNADTKFETIAVANGDDTTSRPDECESCFKNNFKIIINEPDLCKGDVNLLILITSSALNVQNRKAIRNTWGKVCNEEGSGIKCVFVFGTKFSNYENNYVKEESDAYRDVILFDFFDAYANLTYKTLSSIRWSHEFCSQANYVMKTDDDMYVNTELLPFLLKKAPDQGFIGGMCWGPSSPHRDTNSKWFVSFVQYRHSLFPSMCSGTGYVMSRDIADGILRQSPNVPFFYLEDVYVAICVKQLNVRPLVLDGFKNTLVDFDPCVFRNRYITVHGMNGPELESNWRRIQQCPVDDLTQSIIYNGFPV